MTTHVKIENEIAQVARQNGALKAIVFGSYARGTSTCHSDLDVLIIENTSQPFLERIGRYFDALTDRLGPAVEVLVYTPSEIEQIKHRPFIQRALTEGIVVYESGKISPRGSPLATAGQS